jgi:hypothetical protein
MRAGRRAPLRVAKGRLEHTWTLLHAGVRPECVFLRLHDDLILSCGYDVDR